ncbi:MAG: hypothetical protein HY023_09475 [Chloroflexi bacterium]|nr:hypothetical protein [Chloroflexota bacterium]MBI3763584.1 hypothetical protein [Chloroflexota bacterium]
MKTETPDTPLMENPYDPLEKSLIAEYLRSRGYTVESLRDLPEDVAKRLMTEASLYASCKLAEVETRAHFVHEVHGSTPPL